MTGKNVEKVRDVEIPPPAENVDQLRTLGNEFEPPADAPPAGGEQAPPAIDRRVALQVPLGMLWKAGCAQAAAITEVPALNASPEETDTAAQALAIIADILLPADVDPNSKAGQIVAAGAVLYTTVQGKAIIYKAEIAARAAAEEAKAGDKGASGGRQP